MAVRLRKNDMEKIHLYIYIGLLLIIIVLGTGYSVQTHRLGRSRQELELYRDRLEQSTNKQQVLATTVHDITDTLVRTSDILSGTATTVAGLREQLREIKKNYDKMESILWNYYDSTGSNDNSVDNGENE